MDPLQSRIQEIKFYHLIRVLNKRSGPKKTVELITAFALVAAPDSVEFVPQLISNIEKLKPTDDELLLYVNQLSNRRAYLRNHEMGMLKERTFYQRKQDFLNRGNPEVIFVPALAQHPVFLNVVLDLMRVSERLVSLLKGVI